MTIRTISAKERIVTLSIDEARALPQMLGRIVPMMLDMHGTYRCVVEGLLTEYVLVRPFQMVKEQA